jgi:hypothetical protein
MFERIYDSCREHSLSIAEVFVLLMLTRRGGRAKDIASETFEMHKDDPAVPKLRYYRDAISDLLTKGLVSICRREFEQQEKKNEDASDVVLCDFRRDRPGDLVLSVRGYQLAIVLRKELFGSIYGAKTGQRQNGGPDWHDVYVFGESSEACKALADVQPPRWPRTNEDLVKCEVTPPVKIGRWRSSQYEVIPEGYEIVVRYRMRPKVKS